MSDVNRSFASQIAISLLHTPSSVTLSVCLYVCVFVRALKGKRLELPVDSARQTIGMH